MNFVNQPGTLKGFEYQKYNATVDLTSQITDFIKIGTYTSMMYGDRTQPRQGQDDVLLSTMSQAPTYMPWLPDDGSGVRRWTGSAYPHEDHNKKICLPLLHRIHQRNSRILTLMLNYGLK